MKPILNVTDNEVLLPWREYEISPLQIAALTAILVVLVALAYFVDGGEIERYLIGGAAIVVLVPSGLLLARYLLTQGPWTSPLAINSEEMVAQSIFGGSVYIKWSDVYLVAHVHALTGHSFAPIDYNLLVYRKNAAAHRVSLPTMSPEENAKFCEILANITKLHHIELVFDDTEAGQRWIRNLPWI